MSRDLWTVPGFTLLSTLPLTERRECYDSRGKWPLVKNPDRSWWHRHTKPFWPQPWLKLPNVYICIYIYIYNNWIVYPIFKSSMFLVYKSNDYSYKIIWYISMSSFEWIESSAFLLNNTFNWILFNYIHDSKLANHLA